MIGSERWALARQRQWCWIAFPLLLGLRLVAGCDTSLRFDDQDASPVDGTPTGWTRADTCAIDCSLSCSGPRPCTGMCLGACTATCLAGSDCTLTSGNRSVVTCQDSRCAITLQHHGVVRCQGAASCDVTCADECALECGTTAHCLLRCRGDAAPRPVTGSAACRDG